MRFSGNPFPRPYHFVYVYICHIWFYRTPKPQWVCRRPVFYRTPSGNCDGLSDYKWSSGQDHGCKIPEVASEWCHIFAQMFNNNMVATHLQANSIAHYTILVGNEQWNLYAYLNSVLTQTNVLKRGARAERCAASPGWCRPCSCTRSKGIAFKRRLKGVHVACIDLLRIFFVKQLGHVVEPGRLWRA